MEARQMETVIAGGRVMLPDGTLQETDVTLREGRIAAVGTASSSKARR